MRSYLGQPRAQCFLSPVRINPFWIFFFEVSGSQSVPFGQEASGITWELVEMQLLGPHIY